jgi:HEAT repeat protein
VLPSLLVRRALLSLVAAALLASAPASALVWPDVPERIERDLASADPAVRLLAVEKLDTLGPARATPLLLRALTDPDTGVRVAAAEAAIRAHTKGAAELVLPWLVDHDARLRLAACDVTRALPDPRAVAPLARTLGDVEGVVRTRAALALGAQTSAEAVVPLLGKLDDSNPAVRVEVAHALARLGDRRAVVPLIGKVEDSATDVREAVAGALADLGDARATPALILQLRDGSADVRLGALAALAKVHGVDAVDVIAPMTLDHDPTVRHAALAALGALAEEGSADAFRALTARLGLDEDATGDLDTNPLRAALVHAGRRNVAALAGLLRGTSGAAAVSIAWILGDLHAKTSAPAVVDALRHGTLPTAAALHALVGVGGPDDLAVVLEFVGSDNPQVRGQAFAATRALLDPAHPDGLAVDPLVAVAEGTKLRTQEKATVIELLGRTAAPRASPLLQGFVASKDVALKLAALDALAALGPTGADDAILGLITDRDPAIRMHAAAALAASGGATARDALLRKLTDGTELDRVAALQALGGILPRAPSERAWKELGDALDLAAGGERDAILLALGRAAPVHPNLERLVSAGDEDDRRTLATAFAGRADATPLLRELLRDPNASVRAQAAWSLGATGGADLVPDLASVARSPGPDAASDAAVDATAALARVAGRTHAPAALAALCALLPDPRPLVRANALAGLALSGARCGDGPLERALLTDPADRVRRAAARALGATPRSAADTSALARCASTDHSGDVAEACAHPPVFPTGTPHATLAYVEAAPRSDPEPHAAYLVELADGLLRAGTADRQGAFFDPVAPDGTLTLRLATSENP